MEKSHSGCPRTDGCVVDMSHKNGMSPLIRTDCTIFYSFLYCNLGHLRRKYDVRRIFVYSIISVKLDCLFGDTKKWTIDKFVAVGVRFFHSWAERTGLGLRVLSEYKATALLFVKRQCSHSRQENL